MPTFVHCKISVDHANWRLLFHKVNAIFAGMEKKCLTCGQPLPEIRLGARLTPFKATIFDAIKRSGPAGIASYDLLNLPDIIGLSRASLKSHVWQINELIDNSGFHIYGRGRNLNRADRMADGRGVWRLEKKREKKQEKKRDGHPIHIGRNPP